ncbi:MAG: hypothetical protein HFJ25_04885, partial [Clostridia bacterium]|nr:hypothetical protein [Clostridia bacterium]
GEYIIPENATGEYVDDETIEIIYYYVEKEIPITVNHYIEGTITPVPLKDGTQANSQKATGKTGQEYRTTAITPENLNEKYELVEEPENKNGIIQKEEIIVNYYYKVKQVQITTKVQPHEETNEQGETIQVEGGTILGKGQTPYETIDYLENSQKDIIATPDDGYKVSSITVNGVEIEFTQNTDKTVEIAKFENMTENKEIIVSFEKITTRVVVHHYIEGTTTKVVNKEGIEVEDQIYQGHIGDIYASQPAENLPQNYELVSTTNNTSGTMTEEEIEVIYYYNIKQAKIEDEITKQGTQSIIKEKNEITYQIKYKVAIEDYIGKAKITITDKLPYEIDEQKSTLMGGVYNEAEKTITWEETIENINTYENTEKQISSNSENEEGTVENKETANTEANETQVNANIKNNKVIENLTKESINTTENDLEINTNANENSKNGSVNTAGNQTKEDISIAQSQTKENINTAQNQTEENTNTAENNSKEIEITKTIKVVYKGIDYEKKEPIINKVTGKIKLETTNQEKETPEATHETTIEESEPTKITSKIEKEGTDEITSTQTNIYYEINYQATIENFQGKAKITITDNLPYPIDPAESELAEGTYKETEEGKYTITWEEEIAAIDTYKTEEAKTINITKAISVKYMYTEENTLKGTIENKVEGKIELTKENETDVTEEQKVENKKETQVKIPAKIIVHHYIYDEETKQYTTTKLTEDEIRDGIVGDSYTTQKSNKVPNNYTCINEQPEKYQGEMTKEQIEINYYYSLNNETIQNNITKTAVVENTQNGRQQESKKAESSSKTSNNITEKNNQETTNAEILNNEKTIQTKNNEQTEKEGTQSNKLTKEDGTVIYTINYQTTIENYKGKAKITIQDKLPAKIDQEKSNLAGGTYQENKDGTNTITWEEEKEVDTYQNGTYTYETQKEIHIVYKNQDVTKPLQNTVTGTTKTYYPETHTTKPGQEKETKEVEATSTVEQEYKTKVKVNKIWEDWNNKVGVRPENVTITLIADGQKVVEKTEQNISEENNQEQNNIASKDTVNNENNLANENKQDEKISQEQEEVNNKIQSEEANEKAENTIFNNINNEINNTGYSIQKDAIDNTAVGTTNNEQGIIENAINNEEKAYKTILLNEANNWSYTFNDLPKYNELGKLIKYTVEETQTNEGDLEKYETNIQENVNEEATNITVTNKYKLEETQLQSNIEKTGTQEITKSDEKVVYEIAYQATIENYIGNAQLQIVDTLPCKIDITKSNLNGGTYNEEQQTITWTEELENINTEVNGNYEVNVTKQIEVVYKDIDLVQENIQNTVTGTINLYDTDKTNTVQDDTKTTLNVQGKVIVKYIEKATGKELLQQQEIIDKVGKTYKTDKKDIPEYEIVEITGKETGEIKEGTIEVIYYYEKEKAGGIIIKHIDEEGNILVPIEKQEGEIGQSYETTAKEIEGYELIKTPENAKGTMTKEKQEIIYIYKKVQSGGVRVKYLEKETNNQLAEETVITGKIGQSYETERKAIKDYKKAEPEPENAKGTMQKEEIEVIYYYEKLPSGTIKVKYVEKATNKEIPYIEIVGGLGENKEEQTGDKGEETQGTGTSGENQTTNGTTGEGIGDETQDKETSTQGQKKEKTYGYQITGKVGEKYDTKEKDIPYYTYLANLKPTNASGTLTQNDDTVIYYYERKPFNMKLEKKITTLTVNGESKNVGKGKTVKLDIKDKEINETKVEVSYEIKITNTGEIAGTVAVQENIPQGLQISSNNPTYWTKTPQGMVATTKELQPQESTNLKVVLSWTKNAEQLGKQENKAQIVKTTNKAGFEETSKEDNVETAVLILGIKTGEEAKLIVIIISYIAAIGSFVLLYEYELYQKERKRAVRMVKLEGQNVVVRKEIQK